MSAMLKKKGGLGFKPKAPQIRRNAGPSSSQGPERSATAERQSKTPAPQQAQQQVAQDVPTLRQPQVPAAPAAEPVTTTTPVAETPRPEIPPARTLQQVQGQNGAEDSSWRGTPDVEDATPRNARRAERQSVGSKESTAQEATGGGASGARSKSNGPSQPRLLSAPGPPKVTNVPPPPVPPRAPFRPARPALISTSPIPIPFPISSIETGSRTAAASSQPIQPPPTRRAAGPTVAPRFEPAQFATPPAEDATTHLCASIEAAGDLADHGPLQKVRKRKSAADAAAEGDASVQKKRQRKEKVPAAGGEDGDHTKPERLRQNLSRDIEGASGDENSPEAEGAPRRQRRKRSVTPEDAENMQLDHRTVKMADLARDLRIGKKFSKHDEIVRREKQRRAQARLARKLRLQGLLPPGQELGSLAGTPTSDGGLPAVGTAPSPAAADGGDPPPGGTGASGPQFEIVDGQIVVNQRSLQVDRHAIAAAAAGELEEVEEDDFTRLTTSASYAKKPAGPNHWTDGETELFYRALRMLGTDFQMISSMFPGKTRRHVKLKFNREERFHPRRVNAALVGEKTVRIDLDEYKARAGKDYEPVEEIERQQRQLEEEQEEQERLAEEEAAEITAQKRAELYGNRGKGGAEKTAADGAASGDRAGGKGGKGRGKRGPKRKAAEIDTGFGI